MSRTVDNRVVEMQFKNAEFERGINQTITSLNSLEKALNINTKSLDMSGVQREMNNLNISKVTQAVEALSDRFSNLGIVGMTVLQRLTNNAIDLVSRINSATFGQILTGGKARAQKVADAKFKLDGMLETAEDLETVMDSAGKAVNGTAFGLDSAASIASMLVGSGVSIKKTIGEGTDAMSDLDVALRGVAGAAAMSGASFDTIGYIFAQVKAAGRLMGQDMMQLQTRGINVTAELAKSLKLTQEEVKDMVSSGQISFEMFADAMNKSFGDQAFKSNETLQGVLANVRAALSRIGEIFYSGIIENKDLIDFFNILRQSINRVKADLEAFKEPFKNLISSIGKLGSSILGPFIKGEDKGHKPIKVISSIINALANGMQKIADFIDAASKKISDFFINSGLTDIVEEVKDTTEKVEEEMDKIRSMAHDIWFGKDDTGINPYGNGKEREDALGDMYEKVQRYVNAMKAADFDMAKADEIYGATVEETSEKVVTAKDKERQARERAIQMQAEESKKAKKKESTFALFNSILNIAKQISKAFKNVFNFQIIKNDLNALSKAFKNLFGSFKMTEDRAVGVQGVFEGLFSVIELIRSTVMKLITGGLNLLAPVLSKVIDVFFDLGSRLGGVLKRFKDFVVNSDLLGRAGRFLVTTFTKVKNTVGEFFAKFKELPAVKQLKEEFIDIYQNVGSKLIDWFGKGKGAIGDFFNSFNVGDTSVMDKLLQGINDTLQKFIDLSDKSKNNVNEFIGSFKEGGKYNKQIQNVQGMIEKYTKLSAVTKQLKSSKGPLDFISNLDRAVTGGGGGGMVQHISNGMNQVAESFKNLDVAKVTLVGISGVFIAFAAVFLNFMTKAGEALRNFAAFPGAVVGAFKSIKGAFDGVKVYLMRKGVAQIITQIAIAIAVLAGSLWLLTTVDSERLKVATSALGLLMFLMTVMVRTLAGLVKSAKSAKKFNDMMDAFSKILLSMSGSIFLLAASLYLLSNIEFNDQIWKPIVSLIGIMGALVGLIWVINKMGPEFKLGGSFLILYSASVFLLVLALNRLAKLDVEGIKDRMIILAVAMGIVAGMAVAGRNFGLGKAAAMVSLIMSIVLIELALKYLVKYGLTWGELLTNLNQISLIIILIAMMCAYMRAISFANKDTKGVAGVILSMIAVVITLTLALRSLSKIKNVGTMTIAALALLALIAMFGLVIVAIGQSSQAARTKNAGAALLKMAGAIAVLSLVIAFLGSMKPETIGQGLFIVTLLVGLMVALTIATSWAGKIDAKTYTGMIGVLGTLAILIALLSFIKDKTSLFVAALILSTVLIALGFSLWLAGKQAKKAQIKPLKAMILALVLIGALLIGLTVLEADGNNLLKIAASMSMILIALGECARIMLSSFNGLTPAKMRDSAQIIKMMILLVGVLMLGLSGITVAANLTGGGYAAILAAGAALTIIIGALALLFHELNQSVSAANGRGGGQQTINNINIFNKSIQSFSLIGVSLGLIVALGSGAGEIMSSAMALMGVMIVMLGIFKAIDEDINGGESLNAKLKAFHMMIIDLVGIGIAMALITGFGSDWSEILAAAGGLSLVLVAMGGVFLALDHLVEGEGSKLVGKAGAFALASVALIPAAIAISMLANYQWQNLIGAAGALAIVIAIVTGALVALTAINKVGGIVPMIAAAGLLSITLLAIAYASKIFSKAITGVIEAIYSLTQIDYDLIDTSKLGELVGLMLRFALIAIPGAFAIGAIGAALVVLGAGILAVSVGVAIILSFATKFIKALTALLDEIGRLTAMAPVVVTGINLIGKAIGNFFKMTAQSLALGIVVFITTLQMNAILIGTAVKNLILTVLDVIFEAKKAMVGKVIDHITDMFKMLEDKLPELMTRFNNVVTIALSSLAENAETYGYYGALIAIGFLDGLMDGIALKAEELTDSVAFLAISTIRAFKQTWDKYKDLVGTSMLGTYSDASSKFWGTLADIAGDDSGFGQYARENERLLKEESQADSAAVDAEYERMAEERAKKKIEAKNKAEVKAINNSDTSQIKDSNARKQQELYNAEKGQAVESAGETVEAHNNELEKIVGGEYSFEDLKNKYGDSIGSLLGIGPQKANESGQEMTRVITQNVTNIPQSVRDKLKNEGWQFNEAGTEAFKEIQTGIEDESESSLINFDGLTSQFDGLLHGEGGISDMFGNFNNELGGMAGDGAQDWVNGIDSTLMDPANLDLISKDGVKYADVLNNSFTSPEGIDVNSPSKKTIKYANSWLEGLYLGLTSVSWNNKLDEAVINTANSIGDSFNTTTATNGAFAPTIRPVLDTNNMGQYSSFLDVLQNPTTMRLAADSTLAIQSSQDMMVAQQLEAMRGDISRLADKDFSKVLDGVAINVNADTTVDGTVLRKTASNYTIKQINQQEQAILMAKGARG